MDGEGALIRRARTAAGLSLRGLADRAGTSHATIAAYEAGRVHPSMETVRRIIGATGFRIVVELVPRVDEPSLLRGDELIDVLELASQFPARHGQQLHFPRFASQ